MQVHRRGEVICCAHTTTKTTGVDEGMNEESFVQLILASDGAVNVDLSVLDECGRKGYSSTDAPAPIGMPEQVQCYE